MGEVIYNRGNLFKAIGRQTILVHACNCEGVWGSGVAKGFNELLPAAFHRYRAHCLERSREELVGSSLIVKHLSQHVGCLFTSKGFGGEVDSVDDIVEQTAMALNDFMIKVPPYLDIHSPKFNSGLFNVPWHMTEEILFDICRAYDTTWTVWQF